MPLLPPLGSVYFAWSSEAEVTAWLDRHPSSTDAAVRAFRAAVAAVRVRGWSVALEADRRRDLGRALEDLAERPRTAGDKEAIEVLIEDLAQDAYQLTDIQPEAIYDVSTMAAPVFGSGAEVVLAVNLVGFAPGLTGAQVLAYGEQVRGAGLVVTKRTRGRVPEALAG
jgi:DNA-binding IclR family transcriptional regulator